MLTKTSLRHFSKNIKPKLTQLLIHGKFVNAVNGKTFKNYNPSTQELICEMQSADKDDINKAVLSS